MTIQVRSNDALMNQTTAAPAASSEASVTQANASAPGAKPSEHNEALAPDTEATTTEENESESEEAELTEGAAKTEEEADKTQPNKKKGGFQRRIDKLNARVTAREQELEYWKQQALKGAGDTKVERTDSKPAAGDGKPIPDTFDTHAAYVEALTEWKTDQKLKERDQKLENSRLEIEQANLKKSWAEKAREFSEKTPDYDDVISEVDDVPMSQAFRELLLDSKNGPELAYELAKNREEFVRMNKLAPLAAARELGKLESRLESPADTRQEPQKITKAPKPLAPVGAGGKGAAPKSITDPNLSQRDYERLRLEQMKKRRQA